VEKEDLAFMSELKSAAQLKPSRASNIFLWSITAFFAWAVVWAAMSNVDERIHGMGQVMPSSDVQVVQSLEGGVLTDLLVSEGDHVKKDQVLLRINDIQFASEGRGIEAQLMALRAKQSRLKAETTEHPFAVDADIAQKYPDIATGEEKLYRSRQSDLKNALGIIEDEVKEASANLSEVRASIAKLSKSKSLLEHQMSITSKLVAEKAVPEMEKLKLERELNETSGNLSSAVQSAQSLEAKLSGARRKEDGKKGDIRSQALAELNEVDTKIGAIKETLAAAKDKVSRTELKSPVDGVVQKVHIKTVGGVVQPAQKLVEIVPAANDLMIRARIAPADVAFLRPGQDVRVSITAYDSQIYGTLKGRLERIGANTVEDGKGDRFYEIDVRTDRNALDDAGGRLLPISSGMVAETDVIVGKRTILTYLMKPVLRARDRALTEK
jgi:adhesin transport system membrane fusion protein